MSSHCRMGNNPTPKSKDIPEGHYKLIKMKRCWPLVSKGSVYKYPKCIGSSQIRPYSMCIQLASTQNDCALVRSQELGRQLVLTDSSPFSAKLTKRHALIHSPKRKSSKRNCNGCYQGGRLRDRRPCARNMTAVVGSRECGVQA